jgi:hypothetical protein
MQHIIKLGSALWLRSAVVAAMLAFTSTAGTAADYNPGHLASADLAQVARTCETVLRVHVGVEQYNGCVESLSASLSRERQDIAAASDSSAEQVAVSTKSYFYASPDEVHRREELACARLGFVPLSGAFESCVANLAGTLDAIDAPSQ